MKTLVVLSHLRWGFVFQRPQHLLTRLSKYYKIVFIEEPVLVGDDEPEDVFSTKVDDNVTVVVARTHIKEWGFADTQNPVIGPLLLDWIEANVSNDDGFGIWFYTPQALPLGMYILHSFGRGDEFIVFDVMDELSMFANAPKELLERESQLLLFADLVVCGGPSLWKSKSKTRADALCLPSSVDAAHYSPRRAAEEEAIKHVEEKLEHDWPHPRIGFFGVIDERLDIELIAKLADFNSSWQIMMVGPVVKIDPATLPQRDNIHWLGSQDYKDLPMIVQGWDVCMMPFALNDSTKFISPTKTLEYMAAEKPIVSTNIHDVTSLYDDVVEIGYDHEEFIQAVNRVLTEDDTTRLKRIMAQLDIVGQSSWDNTAEEIHHAIEVVLEGLKS